MPDVESELPQAVLDAVADDVDPLLRLRIHGVYRWVEDDALAASGLSSEGDSPIKTWHAVREVPPVPGSGDEPCLAYLAIILAGRMVCDVDLRLLHDPAEPLEPVFGGEGVASAVAALEQLIAQVTYPPQDLTAEEEWREFLDLLEVPVDHLKDIPHALVGTIREMLAATSETEMARLAATVLLRHLDAIDCTDCLATLALILAQKGFLPESRLVVRRFLELGSRQATEWTNIGCIFSDHYALPVLACDIFSHAAVLDPDLGQPRMNIWIPAREAVREMLVAGRHDEGIERGRIALLIGADHQTPVSHGCWSMLGLCYEATGRDVEADTCYRRALQLYPACATSGEAIRRLALPKGQRARAFDLAINIMRFGDEIEDLG